MKIFIVIAIAIIASGCSTTKTSKTTYYKTGEKFSEETTTKTGFLFSDGKQFSIIKFGG